MPSGIPRLVLLLNMIPTTLLGTPPIPSLKNGEACMYMCILHVDVRTKATLHLMPRWNFTEVAQDFKP